MAPPAKDVHSAVKEDNMLGLAGEDYPGPGAIVELIPASGGDAYMSWIDDVRDDALMASIPKDLAQRPMMLAVGERIEVIWKTSGSLRSLPVVLAGIDLGQPPYWRLCPAGMVKRGQRREAVRAPLKVPVVLGVGEAAAHGTTLDVSEGGLRCVLDRGQSRPASAATTQLPAHSAWQVGDVLRVAASFPDLTVSCLSEITRRHTDERAPTELSLRFIGLPEHVEDALRRRVFARLRELRQRGLL
jgi:c-di-GMP-binding flagellar brake protein YcgR